MISSVEQLSRLLGNELASVYLISGDETLLVQEAADAVREAARRDGYLTRELLNVDKGFDWNSLLQACDSLSLFAERRLLELRMRSAKPGDAGAKALVEYVARIPEDTVLLIVMPKMEKAAQRTKWFKALDAAGVALQVWPLDVKKLPAWVGARMRARGLQPGGDAVNLLVERVEGNLLAAAQEIEKLHLLYGDGRIEADDVAQAVSDSARFDVYALVDTALEGDAARVTRMMDGLRDEGVEPVLVLWALARELRSLAGMAAECAAGEDPGQVIERHRVWARRRPLVKVALTRHRVGAWRSLVRRAARVDRIVKGAAAGNAWDELLQLALLTAGLRLPMTRVRHAGG